MGDVFNAKKRRSIMERKTKKMCVSAECGRIRKSVTFPVPEELTEWMNEISRKKLEYEGDDSQTFVVEGGRSMVIKLSILNYGERF